MPKNTVKTIIVDDEIHARQALMHALKEFPAIDVVAECGNGLEAVKAVQEHEPQLMFLDIHMPKLDGFDVLDLLGDEAPLTVFVTAYDEYAIQAFELNALDYLLKPISKERLQKTVQRVFSSLQTEEDRPQGKALKLVNAYKVAGAPLQRILVRDKSEVHVIAVADIQYIESADDYVVIHTENKNYIKQERLQNLDNTLDPQTFCRIHRTSIINISYLVGIDAESKDSKVALMRNKGRLAVSRAGYQKLVQLL